jgi:hypothetical protein
VSEEQRTHMLELQDHEFKEVMRQRERNRLLSGTRDQVAQAVSEMATERGLFERRSGLAEEFRLDNVDDMMKYAPWDAAQREAGAVVLESLTAAIKTILRQCPQGRFRQKALWHIVDARMAANASLTHRGRF